MSNEIKVPVLGESIVEGTLARWHKKVGDAINAGEVLADLETDKVNVEVSATESGVVTALLKAEGDSVAVGEVIATIDASATASSIPAPAHAPAVEAQAKATTPAATTPATPVARNVAAESGVDLSAVSGSGPSGRITKQDVINATQQKSPPSAAVTPAPIINTGERREERVKMSRRRQTIAQRLVQAQQTAAMLTTFNEVDLSRVMDIRKRKKDSFK
jgi:2-oxoglutarate dehydrogenase E2 component (dihydrolipoamide succinyltransferase)